MFPGPGGWAERYPRVSMCILEHGCTLCCLHCHNLILFCIPGGSQKGYIPIVGSFGRTRFVFYGGEGFSPGLDVLVCASAHRFVTTYNW